MEAQNEEICKENLRMQLMQLQKESLKNRLAGINEPWPLRYQCSALTN